MASALATLSVPGMVRAATPSYRLQVVRAEGAGTCPAASVIEEDVSTRLGRDPFTDAGERGIEVVLSRAENKWRAQLYLRVDPNEPDAVRLIESDAAECGELGASVALAVALAIAPDLPPVVVRKPEPVCPVPAPALLPPAPSPSLRGAVALRLLFTPNFLPEAALGTALSVTLHGDLLGANFGAVFVPETKLQRADAQLGFGLSAGFASACLWARTRDPEVWGCIGGRVGALHAVVYEPHPEHPGDRFWWGASSELGLRQRLLGPMFLEAGAAAVFPLIRHRFQVEVAPASGGAGSPTAPEPVYEQGPAAVEGFVGIGLHFD